MKNTIHIGDIKQLKAQQIGIDTNHTQQIQLIQITIIQQTMKSHTGELTRRLHTTQQHKGIQIGDEARMSTIAQTTIIRILPITTTITTIIAAIPLTIAKIHGPSPAIEEFQKIRIIISPTTHNGQKINTIGKKHTLPIV